MRLPLTLLLALGLAAPAAAAPADAVDVAPDGTTVVARLHYGAHPRRPSLTARVGGAPAVTLDAGRRPIVAGPVVAAGPAGRAVVAWSVLVARQAGAYDTETRAVLATPDGFSAPAVFGDGDRLVVDMDGAGDAALMAVSDQGSFTAAAPVGGGFGAAVPLPPGDDPQDMTLTPAGEPLVLANGPAGAEVVADGARTPIAAVPARDGRIAADGAGRVLAAWSAGDGVHTAVRQADGTWGAPQPTLSLPATIATAIAVAPDGTAVVAGMGSLSYVHDAQYPVQQATGSLATGVLTLDAGGAANQTEEDEDAPALAVAAGDGGATLAAFTSPHEHAAFVARTGDGAFQPLACARNLEGAVVPARLFADDAFLAVGDRVTCPAPRPPTVVTNHHPVIGRPVRLRLQAPGSRVRDVRFSFGPGDAASGRAVTHTFRTWGPTAYQVTAVIDGALQTLRLYAEVARHTR